MNRALWESNRKANNERRRGSLSSEVQDLLIAKSDLTNKLHEIERRIRIALRLHQAVTNKDREGL